MFDGCASIGRDQQAGSAIPARRAAQVDVGRCSAGSSGRAAGRSTVPAAPGSPRTVGISPAGSPTWPGSADWRAISAPRGPPVRRPLALGRHQPHRPAFGLRSAFTNPPAARSAAGSAPRTPLAGGRWRVRTPCVQAIPNRPGSPGPPTGPPCQFPPTPGEGETPSAPPFGTRCKFRGYRARKNQENGKAGGRFARD